MKMLRLRLKNPRLTRKRMSNPNSITTTRRSRLIKTVKSQLKKRQKCKVSKKKKS